MKKILLFLLLSTLGAAEDNYAFSFPKKTTLRNPRDFSLYAEGLAFQAKESGLEFAIEDANGSLTNITGGVVKGFSGSHSDYGFNPGLRIGMDFLFGPDTWNCNIVWTFIKITNSKFVHAINAKVLIPLWLIPQTNSTNQDLHAVWDTNFNELDFHIGKVFSVSSALLVNPFLGGRIAFIDQHFSVHYGGFFGATQGAVSHNDNDFAGLGLRSGINTEWQMNPYFSLLGNFAASLLWGNFQLTQQLAQGVTGGYDLSQEINQNLPNIEILLGVSGSRSFYKDRFRLQGRLAYELHQWWDMNQLRRFFSGGPGFPNDAVSRGDFTMNGFSLRLQIDL